MPAYFSFAHGEPVGGPVRLFIFKVSSEETIFDARKILTDVTDRRRSVSGKIVTTPAPYNPDWNFHINPETVGFFEYQIEVCDANPVHVEKHLDEVGGSYLPNSFWCPWQSHLLAEVSHLIDPETEKFVVSSR